jgi:hypothetical protein
MLDIDWDTLEGHPSVDPLREPPFGVLHFGNPLGEPPWVTPLGDLPWGTPFWDTPG